MQEITREEADWLRERLPSAFIVVTSKRKKRKHYAVEETAKVKKLLEKYHESIDVTLYE